MSAPICPYCGARSIFRESSAHLYRRDYGPVWECSPCQAWVGCHPNTTMPLGRLADASLRTAKKAAHAAFDRLWLAKIRKEGCRKHEARGAAYRWLSQQLNVPTDECHIGMFDEAQCARVVELCRPFHAENKS